MRAPPTQDLRSNLGTWAVPTHLLPAIGNVMHGALPNEPYDPRFLGQLLETTYFDTQKLELRKNRLVHDKYITLRLRRYQAPASAPTFALSAKTEEEKFRVSITPECAAALLQPSTDPLAVLNELLPGHLFARLLDVSHAQPLVPAVCVGCTRYAVEDECDRLTLDVEIQTDTGKQLRYAVLEFKSAAATRPPPGGLVRLDLRPRKLSKFLWALEA